MDVVCHDSKTVVIMLGTNKDTFSKCAKTCDKKCISHVFFDTTQRFNDFEKLFEQHFDNDCYKIVIGDEKYKSFIPYDQWIEGDYDEPNNKFIFRYDEEEEPEGEPEEEPEGEPEGEPIQFVSLKHKITDKDVRPVFVLCEEGDEYDYNPSDAGIYVIEGKALGKFNYHIIYGKKSFQTFLIQYESINEIKKFLRERFFVVKRSPMFGFSSLETTCMCNYEATYKLQKTINRYCLDNNIILMDTDLVYKSRDSNSINILIPKKQLILKVFDNAFNKNIMKILKENPDSGFNTPLEIGDEYVIVKPLHNTDWEHIDKDKFNDMMNRLKKFLKSHSNIEYSVREDYIMEDENGKYFINDLNLSSK